MKEITLTKRAALTAQMAIKMEPAMDQELRMLKARGVDIPELVRRHLARQIPRIKRALG